VTIRNKVTLWYAIVLLVSIVLLGGGMYYELVVEPASARANHKPKEPVEEEVGEILLYFVLPGVMITLAGGWWLLRRSLKPLDQLTLAAERINAENLREPLPRTGNGDEVDRLSEVLNGMNQRVSVALNEIHEFMLHASHELKTPLTILHSEIETAIENTPSVAEKERLGEQLDEIQRLSRIVEGLILLARSNSGQMKYAHAPVAFHELVRDAADDAAVLARNQRVKVDVKQIDEGWVLGDRDRLRQMLLNIVENASKYNKPNGVITVALHATDSNLIAEVGNSGDGIHQEDLPNIFKKFYRGSAKSAVDPGGVGLGLSIAQSIARAHNGEISIDGRNAGWTTVRITLPRHMHHPD
jgi:signal transduction histidine kinase